MTDEERQEIVRNLRNYHPSRVGNWTLTRAADEIERLAKENGRLTQVLIDKLAEPKGPALGEGSGSPHNHA